MTSPSATASAAPPVQRCPAGLQLNPTWMPLLNVMVGHIVGQRLLKKLHPLPNDTASMQANKTTPLWIDIVLSSRCFYGVPPFLTGNTQGGAQTEAANGADGQHRPSVKTRVDNPRNRRDRGWNDACLKPDNATLVARRRVADFAHCLGEYKNDDHQRAQQYAELFGNRPPDQPRRFAYHQHSEAWLRLDVGCLQFLNQRVGVPSDRRSADGAVQNPSISSGSG